MGCDYYISKIIYVQYRKSPSDEVITHELSKEIQSCYTPDDWYKDCNDYDINYDSDEDIDTKFEKYKNYLRMICEKETKPNKIFYENGNWTRETYRLNFQRDIKSNLGNVELVKVYKETRAYER